MAESPGQILGILGQGGMIGAPNRQPQQPGDSQGRQSHGAGCGGLDMGEILFIAIVEDFQKRRMAQFLFGVFRQIKDPDGHKVVHPRPLRLRRFVAGDDGIVFIGADRGLCLAPEGKPHAVDFIKGVGKVCQVKLEVVVQIGGAACLPVRGMANDFRSEAPVLGERREGGQVRSQSQINYPGRGNGINQIKEISSRHRLAEMFVKLLQDIGGDVIEYPEPLPPGLVR